MTRQRGERPDNVVDGLARISGKWCGASSAQHKWIAGAWIAGRPTTT